MSDIAAFLTARYDDLESRATRAARTHGPAWTANVGANGFVIAGTKENRLSGGMPETDLWDSEGGYLATTQAAAEHIEVNDPAAALRDIEAKRKILALHKPEINKLNGQPCCHECGDWNDSFDTLVGPWPCMTVRLLAVPYSGTPGYDEAWRVE